MKKRIITLCTVATMVALSVSCRQGGASSERADAGGCSMCVLVDRESEQPLELFRGYDDALLDTLLAEGQTSFRSAINAFLLRPSGESNKGILFDAGLGMEGGVMAKLQQKPLGIGTDDVAVVCLTHLHPDHIGGLLAGSEAALPNADIYLSKAEAEAAEQGNAVWDRVKAAYAGRIHTFATDTMLCDGLVRAVVAPGHTPGHTLYVVDETWMVVGDLLHAMDLQIEHPEICARYDQKPDEAVAARRHYLDYIRQHGYLMCGAHCYEAFVSLGAK